jgi:hypothetical protein
VSLIKFVELERTIQRGVNLNKSCLDLMQNEGAKVVDFYVNTRKSGRCIFDLIRQ